MAIILGSDPWSPSLFQSGVPIDSNDSGNSVVQRVLNAENRSWLDCRNYVFRFPGGFSASATTNYVLNRVHGREVDGREQDAVLA